MAWNFIQSNPNGFDRKDTSKSTVQSSDLSPLQIFVREILQNSLDNNLSESDPVRVSFEIIYLTGDEKINFIATMGWGQLQPHLRASRDRMIEIRGGSMLSNPEELDNPEIPLKLLFIHDYETKGLIGAEMPKEAENTPGPHCFVGLCRNTGDNQKGEEASGGTNGFGKTVLWKTSRIGTVLFYSRLSNPYKDHSRRFFGQTRLEGYSLNDESYRGVGFYGTLENNLSLSIYDDQADGLAAQLLFNTRREGEYGTSMLIVGFDDPECDDDIETPDNTATAMIAAAEEYFWPAIIDGRLSVRCGFKSNGTMEWLNAAPQNREELISFIEAYQAIKGVETGTSLISVDNFEAKIPAGPSESEEAADTNVYVAIKKESEDSNSTKYRNRAALIRGAGMVVGYAKSTRALGGEDFSCVVVSGRACPDGNKENKRSEKLLAYSEPVTHDAWRPDSDNIRACNWWGAATAVRKIVDGYKTIISKRTGRETKHTGDAAPVLANLLALNQGETGSSDRDIHIQNITGPIKTIDAAGSKGIFSFDVKIPAKNDFKAEIKPEKWRLKCSYGFIGEGGRNGSTVKSLNMPISVVNATLDDLDLKLDPAPVAEIVYEGEITKEAQMFSLSGESQAFSGLLADSSRHEVIIRIDKGYGE